jgi:hypothetical protein
VEREELGGIRPFGGKGYKEPTRKYPFVSGHQRKVVGKRRRRPTSLGNTANIAKITFSFVMSRKQTWGNVNAEVAGPWLALVLALVRRQQQ